MRMNLETQIQTILSDLTTPNNPTTPNSVDSVRVDISDIPVEPLAWTNKDVQGHKQQRQTLWNVITKHTGDPRLVEIATRIIKQYNVPERKPEVLARAFQRFVQDNIKFFRERPERFVSPVRTIQWGIGDCDDKTIVMATLLRSFRIPVRLKFIRFISPKTKKRVSHVYPQAWLKNQWVTLETVQKWPMGKDGESLLRDKNIDVKVEYKGDKP